MMNGKHMMEMGKMRQMPSEMEGMKPASVIGPGRSAEQAKKSIVGKLKSRKAKAVAPMASMHESAMSNVSEAISSIRKKK